MTVRTIELFFDLRKDIAMLSLAQYFCELASLLAPEGAEAGDFTAFNFKCVAFTLQTKPIGVVVEICGGNAAVGNGGIYAKFDCL